MGDSPAFLDKIMDFFDEDDLNNRVVGIEI